MTFRIASVLVFAICLAVGVFFFFYGPPLAAVAYAKWQFRSSPEIWMVPKPLAPDFPGHPAGPKLIYFGYEFESPSAEVREERKLESSVILNFSDCAGMVMSEPGPSGDLIRAMQEEASKKGPQHPGSIRARSHSLKFCVALKSAKFDAARSALPFVPTGDGRKRCAARDKRHGIARFQERLVQLCDSLDAWFPGRRS